MSQRLTPYGSSEHASNLAKVGKGKTPRKLVDRMPSTEIAAKVGSPTISGNKALRVLRRNAQP